MAVGTDVGEGPHVGAGVNGALVALGGVDGHSVSHGAVYQHGVGADLTVGAHHRSAPQDSPREQQGPRSHGDALFHIDRIRVHHLYAGVQQGLALGRKILHERITS